MPSKGRVAVFGASGALGQSLTKWFVRSGWNVVAFSRSKEFGNNIDQDVQCFSYDPEESEASPGFWQKVGLLNSVVWAQGVNFNDNIYSFDADAHEKMYRANVLYVVKTLNSLLQEKLLVAPARLCLVSSIWQNLARQNKMSYSMTKAALQGFILSAALDLGKEGHLINAVLPGALDTPMTHANLTPEQVQRFAGATYFNRLPTMDDVCNTVEFLCLSSNTGVTGQFIAVDLGFSHARII